MYFSKIVKTISLILPAGILLFLTSCGSDSMKDLSTAEESFSLAMKKFDKGKYLDASEDLTIITLNYSGTSIVDSAQYMLGECHYKLKEYIIAASEYQRVVDQYPSSPLVDDAKYKIGMCYFKLSPHFGLDQEYSQKCIDEFQEFTEYYPDSPLISEVMGKIEDVRNKMGKKVYKSGELYYKTHDYESALIYFDQVLDNYYDTEFAPESLLKKGESYLKMKKTDEAIGFLNKVIEKYPESPAVKKARRHLLKIENERNRHK
jgi:outer membrane protein assembly factor BamD